MLKAAIRTARPKQWTKNVLVFAAPAAAGVLDQRDALLQTLVAFVGFCLAASGTYFLNDAIDAEADRLHPTKRLRPIAAGELDVRTARIIAGVLILLSLAVTAPINDFKLTGVVAGYVLVTISYTIWLKHEPVIDLAAVAVGVRVPGHRRRCRHRRRILRLVPHRRRRGLAVHRHRQASRGAGRARLRLVRAPAHAGRVLHRVPRATSARSRRA